MMKKNNSVVEKYIEDAKKCIEEAGDLYRKAFYLCETCDYNKDYLERFIKAQEKCSKLIFSAEHHYE